MEGPWCWREVLVEGPWGWLLEGGCPLSLHQESPRLCECQSLRRDQRMNCTGSSRRGWRRSPEGSP